MADLPYNHTDLNDTRLTVTDSLIGLVAVGEGTITTHAPTGADAVALARAILAAAGDTGHIVVNNAEMARWVYENRDECIRSMRERAAEAVVRHQDGLNEDPEEAIRALPLLPDGDGDTLKCAGMFSGGEGVPDLCDGLAGHDGDCPPLPAEDFDAGWPAGHTHARADEARISELEKQVADLAALVHGHGEDIGQAQAAIRGLGKQRTARRYNAWTDG
ncbi:hypothetical protein KGD82_13390 [Nocardiopsis eucommiae]|uniref:Uncharacterized protein n=1 Tax=Nocardiopsis eucommiae TaxID=2831970 RepID=A0A975LCP1_9ACTN|nr:hypothetical protein KGD82_13390 [Nocardiopsis eucommiae]